MFTKFIDKFHEILFEPLVQYILVISIVVLMIIEFING